MDRVRFITHQGKQVLLLDYSHLDDEAAMLAMVAERRRIVAQQPKGSVLTVADLTGARPTKNALMRIKEANVYDQPYVRRAALVGVDEHQKTQVESVETFSHHQHKRFPTMQEALDWLVSEEKAAARK
jgi:hypothetical protein